MEMVVAAAPGMDRCAHGDLQTGQFPGKDAQHRFVLQRLCTHVHPLFADPQVGEVDAQCSQAGGPDQTVADVDGPHVLTFNPVGYQRWCPSHRLSDTDFDMVHQ